MPPTRRAFIRNNGIGLLSFYLAGCETELTPQQARQLEIPFRVLEADQVLILESFAEVLVPGCSETGLAHFIDHQLNAEPADQLLMLKYLGVPQPFTAFYTQGLTALDETAKTNFGLSFPELSPEQKMTLTKQISATNPDDWAGPPAPFFYFVVRNDAVDVFYGTPQGTENLSLPYMAHIAPPHEWG